MTSDSDVSKEESNDLFVDCDFSSIEERVVSHLANTNVEFVDSPNGGIDVNLNVTSSFNAAKKSHGDLIDDFDAILFELGEDPLTPYDKWALEQLSYDDSVLQLKIYQLSLVNNYAAIEDPVNGNLLIKVGSIIIAVRPEGSAEIVSMPGYTFEKDFKENDEDYTYFEGVPASKLRPKCDIDLRTFPSTPSLPRPDEPPQDIKFGDPFAHEVVVIEDSTGHEMRDVREVTATGYMSSEGAFVPGKFRVYWRDEWETQ